MWGREKKQICPNMGGKYMTGRENVSQIMSTPQDKHIYR
jgi:hypothetical protein